MKPDTSSARTPWALLTLVGLIGCSQFYAERNQVVAAARSISSGDVSRLVRGLGPSPDKTWWMTDNRPEPIQHGVVVLRSGEVVRFGVLSHHLSADRQSHSVFETEGYRRFVTGYFCCEVEFWDMPQPADVREFDRVLDKLDGTRP